MSETLRRVQTLIRSGDYIVSRHGFRELVADDIIAEDALGGVDPAVVVEEYPESAKSHPSWCCSMIATDGPSM
jgi:hypothetical protein